MSSSQRGDVALLLRRAGFGCTSPELDAATAAGYSAALAALLAGVVEPTTPAPPQLSAAPPPAPAAGPAARKAFDRAVAADVISLQEWWVQQMVTTPSPLLEKLTLYWHGHFATGVSKVRDAQLMYRQNQLFRAAGGGGFETLTQAVAKDGAMMVWLDTDTDKAAHPNENFAREMMELFTLGIGNYTQDDVIAAAQGFTGWTYNRRDYTFGFQPRQHDFGIKSYLGWVGDWNGTDIVHIAVTRPESARFVVARIWSHFAYPVVATDPVVTDLLPAYGDGLSVSSLLAAVFSHPAFLAPATRTGLVKQPIEWLVGAARSLGGDPAPLARMSAALGQTLFDPPNVGGWGQNGYWLDTATAALRLDFALRLARSADLSAVADEPPGQRVAAAADLLALDGWGPTTLAALGRAGTDPVEIVALGLCSPEYVLA